MKEPYPQFNLRLSDELRALIKEAAKRSGRSQTAEVEARMHESFVRDGTIKEGRPARIRSTDPDARELVVAMEILTNQVELMRRELDARLRGLKNEDDHS